MKKVALLIVLALMGALFLAHWLLADTGYVLIIRDTVSIETTLGFVLLVQILLLVGVVVLTLVGSAMWNLLEPLRATQRWKNWVASRRLKSGFLQLVEGQAERAERTLSAAAEQGDWPLLANLLAAEAAHEQGERQRAQTHLANATQVHRGGLVSRLMEARFALDYRDYAHARQVLAQLSDQAPNNRRVLRMYAQVLESTRDWDALRALMPKLKNVIGEADEARRERRVWMAMLQDIASKPGFNNTDSRCDALRRVWRDVPVALKTEPGMVARYSGFLAQLGGGKSALTLIVDTLKGQWDDRLPVVLEAIDDVSPDALLETLEGWLKTRPDNAALLVTAGRVALKARLWGKAQGFFEAAANTHQSATALAELTRLYNALGDHSKAEKTLLKRVNQLGETLPPLPLPQRLDSE